MFRKQLRTNWIWRTSIVAMAGMAFAVAAVVSAYCPPAPAVHDEFANLLAADTILHGRLANPTPVVWEPLQSIHVILNPSYAAKYPIGVGLVTAIGWATFGDPYAGSWISAAIGTTAIVWMLAGILPRRYALFGGALVATHPFLQCFWSQGLWHGWLTVAGAACVTGSLLRLRRRHSWSSMSWLGVGVALLAISRPYEGAVFALAAGIALLWNEFARRGLPGITNLLATAPAAAIWVALALGIVVAQNIAVTGHWSQLPYRVHEDQYGVAPLFVFGERCEPEIPQANQPKQVAEFHNGWSWDSFQARAGWKGLGNGIIIAIIVSWIGWQALICSLAAVSAIHWLRYSAGRMMAILLSIQLLASAAVCWILPHYLSPMLPLLIVVALVGLRNILKLISSRSELGIQIAKRKSYEAIAFGICVLIHLGGVVNQAAKLPEMPKHQMAVQRQQMVSKLASLPGKHLVLVEYSSDHDTAFEWVYNGADLRGSKVIWACKDRPEWTERLLDAYSDRMVWLLRPDQENPELEQFNSTEFFGTDGVQPIAGKKTRYVNSQIAQ